MTTVDVFLPSSALASGMCLVDTPGIGSVFEANTNTTRAFVAHIDAALVVFGADPPLTNDELALVEQASRETPRFIFILNKADRATEAEREESVAFARHHVGERLGIEASPVLCVSSTEALRHSDSSYDWALLRHRLQQLAGEVFLAGATKLARERVVGFRANLKSSSQNAFLHCVRRSTTECTASSSLTCSRHMSMACLKT